MGYIRNAPKRNLEALRIQQQIAAAALEKAEAELAEIEAQEREIVTLQKRKIDTARRIQEAKNRVELAAQKLAAPPIIWGGPDGLIEAAKESARYDKRRRQLTGQADKPRRKAA
jgi:hypothetical protein